MHTNTRQTTDNVLMIRPAQFGYNDETAINNLYQKTMKGEDPQDIRNRAVDEFDGLVEKMTAAGINVSVYQDKADPPKPDAVFPNNWFSTHEDGSLITWPMFAKSRRVERDEAVIEFIGRHFEIERRYSFEQYEKEGRFLEGTGSLIFDRVNKIAYAAVSPRTDAHLFNKFCILKGYSSVMFHSEDENGKAIYHTNVIMSVGEQFAILCTESVRSEEESKELSRRLENSGKELIDISLEQVRKFAGNLLQLKNTDGELVWVMSSRAYNAFNKKQLSLLEHTSSIVHAPIPTIEDFGGGSVRCMIAEIFLERK